MLSKRVYLAAHVLTKYCMRLKFHSISKKDPIMIFASYPVGYPTLKVLHSNFENVAVVTHYTGQNKRLENKVQEYCKNNNIQYYHPIKKGSTKQQKEQSWAQFIQLIQKKHNRYKMGVACSFGYMIPQSIIKMFQKGIVLAHPSLIPKYRGGSPIFHAIANGEKESGASFLEVSANKYDHGNLLYQIRHPIGEKDSYQKVQRQLSQLMADNIMHVINNVDSLKPGIRQEDMDTSQIAPHQLEARICKQKRLNLKMNADQVYNWGRAMVNPRVKFQGSEIIIYFDKVFMQDEKNQFKPGQVVLKGKKLFLKCNDKLLMVTDWQQITKKALPIHTFINRYIDKSSYKNQIIFQ